MIITKLQVNQILEFTKDLPGVCPVKAGDRLIYLGDSQARILTGQSKGWIIALTITAPVSVV